MGWKRSPKLLQSRLVAIRRKVVRQTGGATGLVVRSLDTEIRKRVRPVKTISKQDDPSGRERKLSKGGLSSVSWRGTNDGVTVTATLEGHFTGARTEAVRGVFRYMGRERDLYRTSLLVVPGPTRMRARSKMAAGFRPHRVNFASSSRLAIWAERSAKGRQELRHVVALDKRAMELLIMLPSLKKKRESFIRAWKRGLKEGLV